MADWEAAQAVAAAWPSAADALLSRVTTIEDAVAALLSGALDDAEREAARRESHRLAGTLGAFGVASGSVLARDLETAFTDMPDPGSAPQLADRVLALRRAVEAGPPAPAEETSADLRVLIAGLPGPRSGAILRAAEGRNWQVTVARTVGTGGAVAASASSMPEPDEADVILLGRGVGDVPGTVERLARTNVATAALVEDGADRLALIRAGARRLIGAELSAEAIVSELAALAADRPRNLTSVLAVDDDPVSLEIIAAALRAAGHEVTTCSDALDFWNALERSRPDLVALDVEMPGADGIELCRALRADPHWRGTPVLFLTATTSSGAVAELFAAGADDYVPKPVQPAELVARVNGRLERMGQARAGAKLDPATGLLRREAAEPQLEWLLTLAVRLRQRFTVAALAVDAFDALADAERDRALNIAGQVARTVLRTGDIGAVWAGGEIVLGMIGADEHDVRRLIEEGVGGLDTRLTGSGRKRVDVALVDDDEVLSRLILDGLTTRGYSTRWLADGDDAARELGGARPPLKADLILLDWDLPARDGLTVLRGLAADGTLATSRVVMLTARASQREILTALELGASDHVAKPFSLAVLMQRVDRVLSR